MPRLSLSNAYMRRLFSLGSLAVASTKIENATRVHEEITANFVDPEVVEFFKYFPEPYRQHAIERYSKRDGLYRWKIFRTLDMDKEKESALMGVFLEDIRRAEQLAKEQQEADRKEAYEEQKRHFHDREIPDWEKWLLNYIPLQPGETMKNKLAGAFFTSSSGVFAVLFAISNLKHPGISRLRAYGLLVSGSVLCICLQKVAFDRLMDLGPFDLSVDSRPLADKLGDDLKQSYEEIVNSLTKSSTRP
ncbi:hypothetical protein BsWGS_09860 [Bradybaena similaris]